MNPPMPFSGEVTPKAVRSYCIAGLPAREELVFKSLVRLLSHRGRFEWLYSPTTSELRVVADGSKLEPQNTQQVLTLGVRDIEQVAYLCMPLRAAELEAELERLGALISPARRLQATPDSVGSITVSALPQIEPMRMVRWPPSSLLGQPGHMRLATLMTGRSMTVHVLAQKSGETLAVCTAFFDDLKKANLLVNAINVQTIQAWEPNSNASPGLKPIQIAAPPGLLARIRTRLGLKT